MPKSSINLQKVSSRLAALTPVSSMPSWSAWQTHASRLTQIKRLMRQSDESERRHLANLALRYKRPLAEFEHLTPDQLASEIALAQYEIVLGHRYKINKDPVKAPVIRHDMRKSSDALERLAAAME